MTEEKKPNLTNALNLIKVCAALRDPLAVNFVIEEIKHHYKNIFKSKKIYNHTEDIFYILRKSQIDRINITKLQKKIKEISSSDSFKTTNPIFFNEYFDYKRNKKPKYYFNLVKKDVLGSKILDFGCGKGFNAQYFSNQGYNVIGADVVGYIEAGDVKFIKIRKISDISKIPETDTTLLFTVLHHIDKQNISKILLTLNKISNRLIIIEDTYDLEYFSDRILTDENSKKLLKLSEKSREHAIQLTDFYGNVISQNLTKINLSFQFKKVSEWKTILQEAGFKNIKVTPLGFPKVSFHGFFQIKIVCDSVNEL